MKLYLDDVRRKPDEFDVIVAHPACAICWLRTGAVSLISLDYDLGLDGDEGETVSNWIEEQAHFGRIKPLEVRFHTDNPVGRKRMEQAINNARRYWDEKNNHR